MYRNYYPQEVKVAKVYKQQGKKKASLAVAVAVLLCVIFSAVALLWAVRIRYQLGLPNSQYQIINNTGIYTAPAGEALPEKTAQPQWPLTLVNSQNPVSPAYQFEALQLSNGEVVDARIYPSLQKMFDDARAQGVYPLVKSGYRSYEQQESLFNLETTKYTEQGYSDAEALEMAKYRVAMPGYSEHQMGIAVDINADKNSSTNEVVYQWLCENSYQYGFILRYPADKTEITGITYEPWHFRYVGEEAAREIYNSGLCLEEYLQTKD